MTALRIKLFIFINDLKSEILSSFPHLESIMAENEIVKITPGLASDMSTAKIQEYFPENLISELLLRNLFLFGGILLLSLKREERSKLIYLCCDGLLEPTLKKVNVIELLLTRRKAEYPLISCKGSNIPTCF